MSHSEVSSKNLPLLVIFSAVALYGVALSQHWPQQATALVVHGHAGGDSTGHHAGEHPSSNSDTDHASPLHAEHASDVDEHMATAGEPPSICQAPIEEGLVREG